MAAARQPAVLEPVNADALSGQESCAFRGASGIAQRAGSYAASTRVA